MTRMENRFSFQGVLQTHLDGFDFKFLFIRAIRVIRGLNFGNQAKRKGGRMRLELARWEAGAPRNARFLAGVLIPTSKFQTTDGHG